jgi:uncharacterized DUF497 family protein
LNFTDAQNVLCHPYRDWLHFEEYDDEHSTEDEDRWATIGPHPFRADLLVRVVWTPRDGSTRIISARKLNRREGAAHRQDLAGR